MRGTLRRWRSVELVVGVMAAAAAGGFLSNAFYRGASGPPENSAIRDGFFKAVSVGATATQALDSVIMATGELQPGTEGIYLLDGLTGEFKGGVINRTSRRFFAQFNYKGVLKDLDADTVKNPKFLMVTGLCDTVQGGRGLRLGTGLIYIAEVTSGNVAAYGLRWDPGTIGAGRPVTSELIPLDKFKFREQALR